MSKREHSISIRFTDEEFDRINQEYQEQLAAVIDGLSFPLSSMIRIKVLRCDARQGNQCISLQPNVRQRKTA